MSLPNKYLVDTNVAVTANNVLTSTEYDNDWLECAAKCVKLLVEVTKSKCGIVCDDGDEIYNEYKNNLQYNGQPGLGNTFFKWFHDIRHSLPEEDRVTITKDGDSYLEFPGHQELRNFDISDRKFIAVANNHPANPKPTIFEATDSKWWGWKKALQEMDIIVEFVHPPYAEKKFKKKFPNRTDV